jgi:hypothetical protein
MRTLAVPRTDFEAALLGAGFSRGDAEGMPVFTSSSATLRHRCVLLDDTTVAFVPAGEAGTGMSPLTAGRDLPASALETQMLEMLAGDPAIALTLHAGGPMLHLDVDARILTTQFALRSLGEGGDVEGQVVLAPDGDVDETATALRERRHPEENLQVQSLIADVAFAPEADIVRGRLEVRAERVRHLER